VQSSSLSTKGESKSLFLHTLIMIVRIIIAQIKISPHLLKCQTLTAAFLFWDEMVKARASEHANFSSEERGDHRRPSLLEPL
jgi:hypothetical protein